MTPQTGILVSVSADGRLDIPPELQAQMEPLSRYEVLETNNEIIFKRIPQSLTWEDLSQRIEVVGIDPEEPSLQEISDIVKDVRKSRRARSECA
jgi:hypothetical protein